jgi:putative Ca2+/H+ antiporter (TMEM165/GDT1 family)
MLLADSYKIPVGVALGAVAGILIISVIASIAFPRKEGDASGGSKPPR